MMNNDLELSECGKRFLQDSVMYAALSVIALSIGTTAEEYLLRFERVLSKNAEIIYSIFEK